MASYMLLEVSVYNVDLPHDEVIEQVELALSTQFESSPWASVDVECVEHAGGEAASG